MFISYFYPKLFISELSHFSACAINELCLNYSETDASALSKKQIAERPETMESASQSDYFSLFSLGFSTSSKGRERKERCELTNTDIKKKI